MINIFNDILEMLKLNGFLPSEKVVLKSQNSFYMAYIKEIDTQIQTHTSDSSMPPQVYIKLTFVFCFILLFLWLSNSI